jgi:hypothetical protein
MGSAVGALKVAAHRTGFSVEQYQANVAAGLKWCMRCKAWHLRTEFGRDRSRTDGLSSKCIKSRSEDARSRYVRRPGPKPGRRYVAPRVGDAKQARARVNYLVRMGILPRPNALPCTDCGHIWRPYSRRHEYDHYRGYAPEHHEHVQPVCTTCHHRREDVRRAA